MFTGIIETRGDVISVHQQPEGLKLEIRATAAFISGIGLGDSIAVDGICLTVCQLKSTSFIADVMPRTASLSHLGALRRNEQVNLERALALGGRLGGHIVTGHIDGQAILLDKQWDGIAYKLSFKLSRNLLDQVVYSGSIAINGVSLTVSALSEHDFSVSLIPHTLEATGFQTLNTGDSVHIETDILGKYVQQFVRQSTALEKGESTCLNSAALTAFLMD